MLWISISSGGSESSIPDSSSSGISRLPNASNCSFESQISLTRTFPFVPNATWYSSPSGSQSPDLSSLRMTWSYCSVVTDFGVKRTSVPDGAERAEPRNGHRKSGDGAECVGSRPGGRIDASRRTDQGFLGNRPRAFRRWGQAAAAHRSHGGHGAFRWRLARRDRLWSIRPRIAGRSTDRDRGGRTRRVLARNAKPSRRVGQTPARAQSYILRRIPATLAADVVTRRTRDPWGTPLERRRVRVGWPSSLGPRAYRGRIPFFHRPRADRHGALDDHAKPS